VLCYSLRAGVEKEYAVDDHTHQTGNQVDPGPSPIESVSRKKKDNCIEGKENC
jgi:hypothetical protein